MSRRLRRIDALEARLDRVRVPEAVEDQFGQYRDDPVQFCRDVLGAESATRRSTAKPYQFEVLHDVAEHPRVVVRSGHGVGKSALDAWAALWWLVTRPLSRVVVVAPEFSRQVRAVLFAEIRKWVRRAKVQLPVSVLASRAMVHGFGEEWGVIGLPATEPDRIEGLHSEAGVLLILDESKGIPQAAYDALQGALTGTEDNRLLVTSTPGGPSGPFYRVWAKGGPGWRRHHLSSVDSSIVSPEWVEERARDWGVGSPLYQARVLGEFPDAGEGVLFPLSLLEAAVDREVETPKDARCVLGVDVARSVAGDKNAIASVRGPRLESVFTWRSTDTMQVVDRVLREVVERRPSKVRVDVGGVGAGVVDRLRQLGHPVRPVHFGGAPDDRKRFRNRRAELFWLLREALEKGELALPDDDELLADLSALRYEFDQSGRIVLEGKDEVRKRLGHSPDRADAVALAVGVGRGKRRRFGLRKVQVGYEGVRITPRHVVADALGLWPDGDPVRS
jgi:phage terminase large subunit